MRIQISWLLKIFKVTVNHSLLSDLCYSGWGKWAWCPRSLVKAFDKYMVESYKQKVHHTSSVKPRLCCSWRLFTPLCSEAKGGSKMYIYDYNSNAMLKSRLLQAVNAGPSLNLGLIPCKMLINISLLSRYWRAETFTTVLVYRKGCLIHLRQLMPVEASLETEEQGNTNPGQLHRPTRCFSQTARSRQL